MNTRNFAQISLPNAATATAFVVWTRGQKGLDCWRHPRTRLVRSHSLTVEELSTLWVEYRAVFGLDQAPEGFVPVTVAQAEKVGAGLFVYPIARADRHGVPFTVWYTSAELADRRTYCNGPFPTQEQACADLRRIAPMYPRLKWYLIGA